MKKLTPRGKPPIKDETDYLSSMNMIGTHSSNSIKEQALFRFATSGLNKGTFDLEQHRIQSDGSNCTFSATGTIRVIDEETILGTIHNDQIYCIMNLHVEEDTIWIDKDVNCPSVTEANSQCMDTPSYSITFQKNN